MTSNFTGFKPKKKKKIATTPVSKIERNVWIIKFVFYFRTILTWTQIHSDTFNKSIRSTQYNGAHKMCAESLVCVVWLVGKLPPNIILYEQIALNQVKTSV